MTNRKAPIEVLERLAEAACKRADLVRDWATPGAIDEAIVRLADAYRAATAPLRTRQAVDAEIGRIMRDAYSAGPGAVSFSAFTSLHLSRLCSEPTADDHGSSGTPAAKESRDNAGVSAGPANALVDRVLASDEPEPEKCSCDESEGLKRELRGCQASLASRTGEVADLERKIEVVRIQARLGVGPHVNPRCPGEAACREILIITSP